MSQMASSIQSRLRRYRRPGYRCRSGQVSRTTRSRNARSHRARPTHHRRVAQPGLSARSPWSFITPARRCPRRNYRPRSSPGSVRTRLAAGPKLRERRRLRHEAPVWRNCLPTQAVCGAQHAFQRPEVRQSFEVKVPSAGTYLIAYGERRILRNHRDPQGTDAAGDFRCQSAPTHCVGDIGLGTTMLAQLPSLSSSVMPPVKRGMGSDKATTVRLAPDDSDQSRHAELSREIPARRPGACTICDEAVADSG